jgi:hypothetical protein
MSKPSKQEGKSYWSKAEEAGDVMEIGLRLFWGGGFAFLFSSLAWTVGSMVWVGVGVTAAGVVIPIGFLVGFFWPEVKFALWLLLKMWTGL